MCSCVYTLVTVFTFCLIQFEFQFDLQPLSESEKVVIDMLIDRGSQTAGTLDYNVVKTLYR